MKALVTGGGGFLGSAIVRRLRDRGDQVTALGRRRYPALEALGIETIQADLSDAAAIERAVAGCDTVFHVAALAGIWGAWRLYWQINVEGTRNVLSACRRAGVARLVYTSSPSVVFTRDSLCGVDESQPYAKRFLCAYSASKAAAEQEVLAANDGHLATVALRPHLIWGPGDPHLIPRIVERAQRGQLAQVGDGRNLVDITYLDNAAAAHVAAADALAHSRACAGRPYFISQGQPVLLWLWINDLLERLGITKVTRSISYAKAWRLGAFSELYYRLFRRSGEPLMTRFLATQLAKSRHFDISAAKRDLGYVPVVSIEEGLDRVAAAWSKDAQQNLQQVCSCG